MNIPELSVKRPVMMTMVVLVFVVMGFNSYRRLSVDLMPSVDIPFIIIQTIYPGAGPKEVETQVTDKLEDVISTVSDVKMFQSFSRESVSIIAIEFKLGVDIDLKSVEVKNKVDAIAYTMPADAEDPAIDKFDINAFPIVEIAVSGPRPLDEIYSITDNVIKDRMSQVSGVAKVEIVGGQEREIIIAADRRKMAAYGIGLLDMMGAIGAANMDMPAGHITETRKEYSVRMKGQFESPAEMERLQITSAVGGKVYLKDIATVVDGFEEQRNLARFQGQPTINVSVTKRSDANTIATADGVFKAMKELKKILPDDIELVTAKDGSWFIRDSVADVQSNIVIGILLASLLIYFFLHSLRSTIIVATVLPTSMISTFLLIDFAGFSINIMTLMSLGISVGMLITNAIVVLENIAAHRDRGKTPHQAAIDGTNEVAVAVAASTLTNIVVFTPVAFMSGLVGQFFMQFGMTTVFATIFSLLVSFTMTPMMASRLLRSKEQKDLEDSAADSKKRGGGLKQLFSQPRFLAKFAIVWDATYEKLADQYEILLDWSLDHKKTISAGVFAIFAFSIFIVANYVGGEFFPASDQGEININVKMPPGTSLEATNKVLFEIESIIEERVPERISVLSKIGGENSGVEDGAMLLKVTPKAERKRSLDQVINELRPFFAVIPSAEIALTKASMGGPPKEADLELEVYSSNMDDLRDASERIKSEIFANINGLTDVKTTYSGGKPEITFVPDRAQLAAYNIPLSAIAMTLRSAFAGMDAGVYREAGDEFDIIVQLQEDQRNYGSAIEDLSFTAGPLSIPLKQLGRIEYKLSEAEIRHKNKARQINVQANIAGGTASTYQSGIQEKLDSMDLPKSVTYRFGGDIEEMQESFQALFEALIMAIILTFMVLAAILESLIHPFTIMFTLPLGFVGAVFGLFFGNSSINMLSLMAVVMLVGIVVNNAILILDYTQILRSRGAEVRDALLESAKSRLKPILMTNLAIVLGMLPQATGGQEFRVSMAAVTIGGVVFSTIFTLFFIPVLFITLDRFAKPPELETEKQE